MKKLAQLLFALVIVFSVATLHVTTVFANSNYGTYTYGSCTYGPCNRQTVAETPDGLQVAINLTNGQVIPKAGYEIRITPLNGAGASFKEVKIYIDGNYITTIQPAENGTATWFWDVDTYPGTNISFDIIDTSDRVTNQEFTISIESDTNPLPVDGTTHPGTTARPSPTESASSPLAALFSPVTRALSSLSNKAEELIRKLPAPVVYAFPWTLFLLLVIQIVILILQSRRELQAVASLDSLIAQQKEIAEMKRTFMGLLEHYLRTPFTIMSGGAEMLQSQQVAPEVAAAIQLHTANLKEIIESTVRDTTNQQQIVGEGAVLTKRLTLRKIITYGLLGISVLLMIAIAFWFVYLANRVTDYDVGTVGVIIQFVLFATVGIMTFQVFRRMQLRKTERKSRELLEAELAAIHDAKDAAIQNVSSRYGSELAELRTALSQVPEGLATKFLSEGFTQLSNVEQKFVAVTMLKGAQSTHLPEDIQFSDLSSAVIAQMKEKADAKHITIQTGENAHIAVQEPNLLNWVLQSLLDNAVAYSPDGSTVSATATQDNSGSTITVSDSGRGIPLEDQDKLFQAFYKSEGADDFTHEGMGLSLYLDKLIMQYLRGTIDLTSEPDKGTQVSVKLPAIAS